MASMCFPIQNYVGWRRQNRDWPRKATGFSPRCLGHPKESHSCTSSLELLVAVHWTRGRCWHSHRMHLLLRSGFAGRSEASEARSCSDSHRCWMCRETIVVAQHPGSIGRNHRLLTLSVLVDPRRFVGSIRFVHSSPSSFDSFRFVRTGRSSLGSIRLACLHQCSVGLPGSVVLIRSVRTNQRFVGFAGPAGSLVECHR